MRVAARERARTIGSGDRPAAVAAARLKGRAVGAGYCVAAVPAEERCRGTRLRAAPAPPAGRGPAGAERLRAPGALAPTCAAPGRRRPPPSARSRGAFSCARSPRLPPGRAAPPAAAAAGTAARPPPPGLRRACAAPCRPECPLLL